MSGPQSPILFAPDAYDVIAAAMNESERGRWFLEEHARRSRGPDTATLLDAIGRIESAVTAQRPPEDVGHLRGSLLDMANAISRTKAEIAAISAADQDQSRLGGASEALDAIVRTTERATTDILGAAEEVQETAWTLRERGVDADVCDRLDRHATQIYTACSFQDLTAQRISRIVNTLRYLEDRLGAMIAIWDGPADAVPPAPGASPRAAVAPVDLSQSDVDRFIDMQGEPVPAAPRTPIVLDEAIDFLPAQPFDLAEAAEPFEAAEAAMPSEPEAEPHAAPAPAEAEALDFGTAEAFALDDLGAEDPALDELASEVVTIEDLASEDLVFEDLSSEGLATDGLATDDLASEVIPSEILASEDPAFGAETVVIETAVAEEITFGEPEPVAEPMAAPAAPPSTRAAPRTRRAKAAARADLDLGDIDLLSIEEKLALFS